MREAFKVPYDAKTLRQYVHVPEGLAGLMEGLVKEVLRKQPSNIVGFAADYFENLVRIRDETAPTSETTTRLPKTLDLTSKQGEKSKFDKILRRRKQIQSQNSSADKNESFETNDQKIIKVERQESKNDTLLVNEDIKNHSFIKIFNKSIGFDDNSLVDDTLNTDINKDNHQIIDIDHNGVTYNDGAGVVNNDDKIQICDAIIVDNEINKLNHGIEYASNSQINEIIALKETTEDTIKISNVDKPNDDEKTFKINMEKNTFSNYNTESLDDSLSNKESSTVKISETPPVKDHSMPQNTQVNNLRDSQEVVTTDITLEPNITNKYVSESNSDELQPQYSQEKSVFTEILTTDANINYNKDDTQKDGEISFVVNSILYGYSTNDENFVSSSKLALIEDKVDHVQTQKNNFNCTKVKSEVAANDAIINEYRTHQNTEIDNKCDSNSNVNVACVDNNVIIALNDNILRKLDDTSTVLDIENKLIEVDVDIKQIQKEKENSLKGECDEANTSKGIGEKTSLLETPESECSEHKFQSDENKFMNTNAAAIIIQKAIRRFISRKRNELNDAKTQTINYADDINNVSKVSDQNAEKAECKEDTIQNDRFNFMNMNTAANIIQRAMKRFVSRKRDENIANAKKEQINLVDDINHMLQPFDITDGKIQGEIFLDNQTSSNASENLLTSRSTEDDSSALSSAATIIQAGIRGFLTRKSLQKNKMADSSDTTAASLCDDSKSLDESLEWDKAKYNIDKNIVLENFRNPVNDTHLSIAGSVRAIEARKRLKREDAIQSQSPHSSGEITMLQDDNDDDEESIGDLAKGIITEIIMNPKKELIEDNTRESFIKRKSITFDDCMFSNSPEGFHDKMNIEKTKLFLKREREFSDLIENDEPINTGSYESYQTVILNHHNDSNGISVNSVNNIALENFNAIHESLNNASTIPFEDLQDNFKESSTLPLAIDEQDVVTVVSKIDLTAAEMIQSDEEIDKNLKDFDTSTSIDVVDVNCNENIIATLKTQHLLHSGEFHDVLLPARIERSDATPLRGE